MIFHEIYSSYYRTVAHILRAALQRPLSRRELRSLIREHAFGESSPAIERAFVEGRWPLLRKDGSTPLEHVPARPLTTLEKRWLNAVFADPRLRLFTDEPLPFPDVEPLFRPDDILLFDQYTDGDPYTDPAYIRNFRLILHALQKREALQITATNRRDREMRMTLMPEYLEYSEKDDKFRLIGSGFRHNRTVMLARILSCVPCIEGFKVHPRPRRKPANRKVVFELRDERNALERALLHFAHFEKRTEKTGTRTYRITMTYDRDDETEILIRLLSFGPMIKVCAPDAFVDLVKERLLLQKRFRL